jgi:hypothetical protein
MPGSGAHLLLSVKHLKKGTNPPILRISAIFRAKRRICHSERNEESDTQARIV